MEDASSSASSYCDSEKYSGLIVFDIQGEPKLSCHVKIEISKELLAAQTKFPYHEIARFTEICVV